MSAFLNGQDLDEDEDITVNPFYQAVLKLDGIDKDLIQKKWMILVPQVVSLPASTHFSEQLLRLHIVAASPYNTEELMTVVKNRAVVIKERKISVVNPSDEFTFVDSEDPEINQGDQHKGVTTHKKPKANEAVKPEQSIDLNEERTVDILFEETFYQEKGKYKVVCISRPLFGLGDVPLLLDARVNPSGKRLELFKENRHLDEWIKIFNLDEINQLVMNEIDDFISDFIAHYVLVVQVESSIQHATSKIRKATEAALEFLIQNNSRYAKAINQRRMQLVMLNAFECLIFQGLHDKVFGSLCEYYLEKEVQLQNQMTLFSGMIKNNMFEMVGLRKEYKLLDLKDAIHSFKKMNSFNNPLGKLSCLNNVLRFISEAVSTSAYCNSIIKQQQEFDDPATDTTSNHNYLVNGDDLLPLLVYVILLSSPQHIHANYKYMKDFICTRNSSYSLSQYYLAQLEASFLFIQGYQSSEGASEKDAVKSNPFEGITEKDLYSSQIKRSIPMCHPSTNTATAPVRSVSTELSTNGDSTGKVAPEMRRASLSMKDAERFLLQKAYDSELKILKKKKKKKKEKKSKSALRAANSAKLGGFLQALQKSNADVVTSK